MKLETTIKLTIGDDGKTATEASSIRAVELTEPQDRELLGKLQDLFGKSAKIRYPELEPFQHNPAPHHKESVQAQPWSRNSAEAPKDFPFPIEKVYCSTNQPAH